MLEKLPKLLEEEDPIVQNMPLNPEIKICYERDSRSKIAKLLQATEAKPIVPDAPIVPRTL